MIGREDFGLYLRHTIFPREIVQEHSKKKFSIENKYNEN